MNNIIQNLTKKINTLNSQKKLVLFIILILFCTFIYFGIVKNSYRENEINYKKIDFSSVISTSDIVYDRATIKSLDEVLENILMVNYDAYYIDNKKVTLRKVYDNLIYNTYQKEVSYGKFKNKINDLYNNILGNSTIEVIQNKNFINKVYFSNELGMYFLEISHLNDENNSYIGIMINEDEKIFKITYVQE